MADCLFFESAAEAEFFLSLRFGVVGWEGVGMAPKVGVGVSDATSVEDMSRVLEAM